MDGEDEEMMRLWMSNAVRRIKQKRNLKQWEERKYHFVAQCIKRNKKDGYGGG